MRIIKTTFILLLILMLPACRSKPPQLYVLNPLPCCNSIKNAQFSSVKIGLDAVKIPDYIQKPQIVLHYDKNQVKLAENHEWAEGLNKNIQRILQANLTTLLPGAIVESPPWDSKFNPDFTVQIIVSEFETDTQRNVFRAEYIIFQKDKVIFKGNVCYKNALTEATPKKIVLILNQNITLLSQKIASSFKTFSKDIV